MNLNLLLAEIMMGKSPIKNIYFKHFTILEQFHGEFLYEVDFKEAISCGVKSEDQLLEAAKQKGHWTKEDEDTIVSLNFSIGGLSKALAKNDNIMIKNSLRERIDKEKAEIASFEDRKRKILSNSAEQYAENKRNNRVLCQNLFVDSELTQKLEEGDITSEVITSVYKKINLFNSREDCAKIAYNSAFFDIFSIHEVEPYRIFGKGGQDLTFAQKNLISLAKIIMNKLKHMDIPESKLNDPIAILNFKDKKDEEQYNTVSTGREAKEILDKKEE